MSIIIKGMEMPHNCFQCPLSVLKGERLFCEVTKEEVLRAKLAPECPLHELQPHGDLIGRDGLPKERVEWEDIDAAPVIVPADKEETE
jgi:hypothetical protein